MLEREVRGTALFLVGFSRGVENGFFSLFYFRRSPREAAAFSPGTYTQAGVARVSVEERAAAKLAADEERLQKLLLRADRAARSRVLCARQRRARSGKTTGLFFSSLCLRCFLRAREKGDFFAAQVAMAVVDEARLAMRVLMNAQLQREVAVRELEREARALDRANGCAFPNPNLVRLLRTTRCLCTAAAASPPPLITHFFLLQSLKKNQKFSNVQIFENVQILENSRIFKARRDEEERLERVRKAHLKEREREDRQRLTTLGFGEWLETVSVRGSRSLERDSSASRVGTIDRSNRGISGNETGVTRQRIAPCLPTTGADKAIEKARCAEAARGVSLTTVYRFRIRRVVFESVS